MIRLLVGLGNPGPEYEATRHNAGFWWVDVAARKLGAHLAMDRGYLGLVARVNVAGQPRWLLQPQTYMNLSGRSVAALARFFKILPGEILVVHDELDLLPGQVKLKQGGWARGPQRTEGHPRPAGFARLLAHPHRHRPPGRPCRGGQLCAGQAPCRRPRGHRAGGGAFAGGAGCLAGGRHGSGDASDPRRAAAPQAAQTGAGRQTCRRRRRRGLSCAAAWPTMGPE